MFMPLISSLVSKKFSKSIAQRYIAIRGEKHTTTSYGGLNISFGKRQTRQFVKNDTINLEVKIPLIDEQSINLSDVNLGEINRSSSKGSFQLIETNQQLVGVAVQYAPFPLKDSVYDIYAELFQITKGWNLCRIWNYVPYINSERGELENYKSFCQGRSLAFEEFYGENFEVKLPAGTAVGIEEDVYVIYFVATKDPIVHVENPEQVPAFYYPRQYGPRSPSFARGTLAAIGDKHVGYISGTASIKGHKTVHQGDIVQQFYTTLDNIKLVCQQMGYGNELPDPKLYDCHFTVYLRQMSDLPTVQEMIGKNLPSSAHVIYLHSDICRKDLDLEIEATISER